MEKTMLSCQTLQRHPGMFWKMVSFLLFVDRCLHVYPFAKKKKYS